MTLILFASCANCQNIIQKTEKDLDDRTICELSDSNNHSVRSCGSMLKWFSDTEAYSDAIKDDVCNWIKKALGEGRKPIFITLKYC